MSLSPHSPTESGVPGTSPETPIGQSLKTTTWNHDLEITELQNQTGAEAALAAGVYLGRYLIKRRLGTGGFGDVWQAYDPLLQRDIAIKVLRQDRLSSSQTTEIMSEARRLAQLDCPQIVKVLDAGIDRGHVYFVSVLMEGGTLQERLSSEPFSSSEAVRIAIEIGQALQYAHERGYVHRDVKPSNILFNRHGQPFLADFGLSGSDDELLRERPGITGTYQYMSPEQARGHSHLADPRSDVYGLGVVLYRLLSGRLPFAQCSRAEYLEQVTARPPKPIRSQLAGVPLELDQIVQRALQPKLQDRLGSAQEFVDSLRSWSRKRERQRYHQWMTLVVALAFVAATGILAAIYSNSPMANGVVSSGAPASAADEPAVVAGYEAIAWDPIAADDRYSADPQTGEFQFKTTAASLFKAGQIETPQMNGQLRFSQNGPLGHVGLFWGMQSDVQGNQHAWGATIGRFTPTGPCELIVSQWTISDAPGRRRAVRSATTIYRNALSSQLSERPLLTISADTTTIKSINIDGVPVIDDPLALSECAWCTSKVTSWGVCGNMGSFNIHQLSLLKP